MKGINTNYTFTPVSKQVDFSTLSGFDVRHLTAIINVTANQIIYAAGKTGYGLASIAGSVITLQYDTTAMNSGDKLAVFYDATSISVDTGLSQPLTDTQLRATAVPVSGSVSVSNFPTTQPISGSVSVSNFPATQDVSVTSSALPTGASTSALQTTGNNSLASIDSKLQFEYGNDGRVRTGEETLLFFDQINGNVVNSELWKATLSGMALTQTNGTMVLNSGSALTANSYYNLVSSKSFNRVFEFPIYVATQFKYTVGNTETIEFGLLSASTNAAPTDGFFIRINNSGVYGVCTISGTETTSLISGPTANNDYYSDIVIYDKSVAFEIQDINGNKYSTSIQFLPSAASNARLGVSYRIYNGGTTATTASTLSLYAVSVVQMDWATEKPYDEQMSTSTHNFSQIEPLTFVKTANWTNNTQPSTATLSNTTAGYTTLGGYFRFSNLNGSNTDYALFAYQVPVGFSLVINGITVDTAVTTTLGATAGILSWAAGLGCSAVSLATTDSWPTSSAPKFVPLGMQGFSSASVVGTVGTPLNKHFDTPIVVEGGEYLHIILRVISGTGTGQYTGMVGIDGYFE